eukprot:g2434.t1
MYQEQFLVVVTKAEPPKRQKRKDPELYEQLSKQRRLVKRADTGQTKKGEAALTQVSERIQTMGGEEDDEVKEQKERELLGLKKDSDTNVALTATTEFCNVVQTPLEKIETLKHESFRGSTLYKQQATQRKGIAAGERKARKAGLAEEVSAVKDVEEELEQSLIEDSLDLSCASGLEYLRARSQIVDGDIKLEYRDDFGRVQTPKEAFRSISWKFHGKVPGRKNMERRLLRLENEMRLTPSCSAASASSTVPISNWGLFLARSWQLFFLQTAAELVSCTSWLLDATMAECARSNTTSMIQLYATTFLQKELENCPESRGKVWMCPIQMTPMLEPVRIIHEDEDVRVGQPAHIMDLEAANRWLFESPDSEARCPFCRGAVLQIQAERSEDLNATLIAIAEKIYTNSEGVIHKAVRLRDARLLGTLSRLLPASRWRELLLQKNAEGKLPFELLPEMMQSEDCLANDQGLSLLVASDFEDFENVIDTWWHLSF